MVPHVCQGDEIGRAGVADKGAARLVPLRHELVDVSANVLVGLEHSLPRPVVDGGNDLEDEEEGREGRGSVRGVLGRLGEHVGQEKDDLLH